MQCLGQFQDLSRGVRLAVSVQGLSNAFWSPPTPRVDTTMRVGSAVGCWVTHCTTTRTISLHCENLLACLSMSGSSANAPLLSVVFCAATILNTCEWMQTPVYQERDCRKPRKFEDTLSRDTARAASGGLRFLLVSTRPSSTAGALLHCTCARTQFRT